MILGSSAMMIDVLVSTYDGIPFKKRAQSYYTCPEVCQGDKADVVKLQPVYFDEGLPRLPLIPLQGFMSPARPIVGV